MLAEAVQHKRSVAPIWQNQGGSGWREIRPHALATEPFRDFR